MKILLRGRYLIYSLNRPCWCPPSSLHIVSPRLLAQPILTPPLPTTNKTQRLLSRPRSVRWRHHILVLLHSTKTPCPKLHPYSPRLQVENPTKYIHKLYRYFGSGVTGKFCLRQFQSNPIVLKGTEFVLTTTCTYLGIILDSIQTPQQIPPQGIQNAQ